jgi:transglutaminase-like putative cysteine protease
MFGATIHIRPSDRETALRPHAAYSVLTTVMTPSPYRMSGDALRGHIRFRFEFSEGFAFSPPATGEQRVTLAPDGVTLDICAECGPGLAADPDALADALRPTPWLQSDDRRIQSVVRRIAGMQVSDARKMELLIARARPYIAQIDFGGHYSALDTMKRRAGDCTEAAALLAALGRAVGIPTRVANGMTYSRAQYHGVSNAFMPHSWTLAWVDGRWRSYDLALGEFDSAHIALTVGDGDPRSIAAAGQLASLMRFADIAEVRVRPPG